jgi:hypothetical protein
MLFRPVDHQFRNAWRNRMKYTLFLYGDESGMASMPPEAMQQTLAAFQAYTKSLQDAGVFVATDWLQPSFAGTTITLREGGRRVQDGPYAATKEQLGGFYIIDVANLDAALAWAEKCPAARHGIIEVRPSAMG